MIQYMHRHKKQIFTIILKLTIYTSKCTFKYNHNNNILFSNGHDDYAE